MDNAMNCKHHYKLGAALKQDEIHEPIGCGLVKVRPAKTAKIVRCWKCIKCGWSITN